ncbi:MAG: preprotein translocase subunit YajC [Alphaproteobacteria bacterium]|nr:preprotein translocase subunit YajC [Alphaproteobacteria bacterium]
MEAENIAVVTDTVTNAPKNDIWGLLLYLLVVFGIIYLFMVRPQRRRMAEYKKMLDAIKVGNRVMAGGIYGTVKKVGEKTLEIEIAKGVVVEVNKNAVATVE